MILFLPVALPIFVQSDLVIFTVNALVISIHSATAPILVTSGTDVYRILDSSTWSVM
jgi:hypothetical protein